MVLIGNNTNGDDGDRYINASWIDLPGAKSRYIATMGPMHPASYSTKQKPDNDGVEDTIPDFWEMCWSTKARVLVMLCTVETGLTSFQNKCLFKTH